MPSEPEALRPTPTRREIFAAFFKIGISAFGGAMPWVRRVLVDQKRWLSNEELTDILTVCQAVPGPNVVNVTVFFGTRCHGVLGGAIAFIGLMGTPFVLLLLLNALYHEFSHLPFVKSAMYGMGVVATAYLVSFAVALAKPFRRNPWANLLCLASALASALLSWPIAIVLLVCGAVGVLLSKRGIL
jgi:chromate transporter